MKQNLPKAGIEQSKVKHFSDKWKTGLCVFLKWYHSGLFGQVF